MRKFFFIPLLMMVQSGYALLSPLAQSSVEIKTILESPELSNAFGAGEQIKKIEKTSNGYEISTARSSVSVEVIPVPSHMIGPQKFNLKFEKAELK